MEGREEQDTNLYVKGLPAYFTQAQVIALFQQYGAVTQARCMPPPAGKADATALVRTGKLQEAHSAILALNGSLLGDPPVPPMMVRYHGPINAPPSDNLYLKGLLPITTEEMLRTTFSLFGMVRSMRVMQPRPPATDCTALIRMGSMLEATAAMQALNGQMPPGHQPQVQILVRFADNAKVKEDKAKKQLMPPDSMLALTMMAAPQVVPPPTAAYPALQDQPISAGLHNGASLVLEVQYQGGANVPSNILQVKGLPSGISQAEVQGAFQSCGSVQSVCVMPGAGSAAALVRMGSVEEAALAISALHDTPLLGPGSDAVALDASSAETPGDMSTSMAPGYPTHASTEPSVSWAGAESFSDASVSWGQAPAGYGLQDPRALTIAGARASPY